MSGTTLVKAEILGLIDSQGFDPGHRPYLLGPGIDSRIFNEGGVFGKRRKFPCVAATQAKADRWHSSGGTKGMLDLPVGAKDCAAAMYSNRVTV